MEISQSKQVLTLIAVLCFLMLVTANLWGVIETSEARYAEISREILRSGDWLHPKLLNIYHYHKPIITYWLTAAAYSVLGVNPFATRFFLSIAYGIQIFLIFNLAQHLFKSKHAAYYAALVYATLPMVLISVRGLTTDAYLTTFVMLSVYAWIRFLKSGKTTSLYGMAVAMGLAFMTKGPVAFIVPLFAMAGLRKWYQRPRVSISKGALAVVIFVCVGFSWFAFLIMEDLRFADYFFFRHFVDRLAHAEVFARKEPWYYYFPIIPIAFLPWITFFFAGFFNKTLGPNEHDQKLTKRLAVWLFLFPLIIFSISSSKLVLYILPLSIGFSLVTGYFLSTGIPKRMLGVFSGLIFLVYLGLILMPLYIPKFTVNSLLTFLPLAALSISLVTLFLKLSRERIVSILATLFSATLILFASQFFRLNSIEVNSLSPVSSFIKKNNLSERSILVYDEFLPSLAFDLDKHIISVYAGNGSLRRETQFEKNDSWKNSLIDTTDQASLIKLKSLLSKKCVLIVKKELPSIVRTIMPGYWHKKTFGKWMVYYN